MSFDYLFKFILVGDSGVGKSCLLWRFMENRFRAEHDLTIGVEFGAQVLRVGKHTVKAQVWDTAGQECFRSITKSYYRGAAVAVCVFDVTNRLSFQHLDLWLREVHEMASGQVQVVIVANKTESPDRKVHKAEIDRWLQDKDFLFMEVSAKTGQGVAEVFRAPAEQILKLLLNGELNPADATGIKLGIPVTPVYTEPPRRWAKFLPC